MFNFFKNEYKKKFDTKFKELKEKFEKKYYVGEDNIKLQKLIAQINTIDKYSENYDTIEN